MSEERLGGEEDQGDMLAHVSSGYYAQPLDCLPAKKSSAHGGQLFKKALLSRSHILHPAMHGVRATTQLPASVFGED